MPSKPVRKDRGDYLPDTQVPERECDSPSHYPSGKRRERGRGSRSEAKPTFISKSLLEELTGEAIVVDPQSLPVEQRIRYYRSEIKKLDPSESFRDEVLVNVYRYLLVKSLGERELD